MRYAGATITLAVMGSLFTYASADTPATDASPAEKPVVSPVNAEEEVEIDLDNLEEKGSARSAHSAVPEEPMLEVRITEREIDRMPWLALIAVVAALPVALMLVPPRRTNRRRSGASDDNTNQRKKEA